MATKILASVELLAGVALLAVGCVWAGKLLGGWEGSVVVVGGWILLASAAASLGLSALVSKRRRGTAAIFAAALIAILALLLVSGSPTLRQPL